MISDETHSEETTGDDHRYRDTPSALSHHDGTPTTGPGRVAHRGDHSARTSRVTVAVGSFYQGCPAIGRQCYACHQYDHFRSPCQIGPRQ